MNQYHQFQAGIPFGAHRGYKPAVVPTSLPPLGKVDSAKNACIVSPKTDEVLDIRTTLNAAEARGGRLGRTSSAPYGGTFPTGGRLDGGTDVVEVVVDIVIPEAEYSQAEGGMLGRTSSAPFGGTFPTGGRLDGGTDVVEVAVDIVIPEAEHS